MKGREHTRIDLDNSKWGGAVTRGWGLSPYKLCGTLPTKCNLPNSIPEGIYYKLESVVQCLQHISMANLHQKGWGHSVDKSENRQGAQSDI